MTSPTVSSAQDLEAIALTAPHVLMAEWHLVLMPPDMVLHPYDLPDEDQWKSAKVPGTAFEVLHGREVDLRGNLIPLHDHDIWYRAYVHLAAGEKLRFDGLAGLAEVWVNDELAATTTNMFRSLNINIRASGYSRIFIRFRSLNKALQYTTGRPRWRTKLVNSNALRIYRQTLLGHMSGWCPNVHAVGPYRPIYHLQGLNVVETCLIQTKMQGWHASLSVQLKLLLPPQSDVQLKIEIGHHIIPLTRFGVNNFGLQVVLTDLKPWWPHTHGDPNLYEILLTDGRSKLILGKTGFRDVSVCSGIDDDRFQIEVNGIPIFCRGACWTSADLVGLGGDRDTYLAWLVRAKNAGMNMIRISGTMLYESRHLHDVCDELGIMVWQDLMFANLDYPVEDQAFKEDTMAEVKELLERTGSSPSLMVICGGSEVAQQAVLLRVPKDRRDMSFFESFLKTFVLKFRSDVIYIPNSPWGGVLPISVNAGPAHYYGVGAYQRPLDDARRADVRFAAECLAFANLPAVTPLTLKALTDSPQDPTTTWTFADTRNHYLKYLYNVDPLRLRSEDPTRYLDLSQATTADLMESVFSEWRRPKSSCAGGLVWQLQDLGMGSGWGVIDSGGHPKSVWYALRRILAPMQILISDEGASGLDLHILNEKPRDLSAIVRLTCLNHSSTAIIDFSHPVVIEAHGYLSICTHSLTDGFFDINRFYRFGPSEHRVTAATITCPNSGKVLSQAFHFPMGRDLPIEDIGLDVEIMSRTRPKTIKIKTKLFAQSVKIIIDGYIPEDNWFHLLPDYERVLELVPINDLECLAIATVTALNSKRTYTAEGES